MSRIHDALKKAETERARMAATATDPDSPTETSGADSVEPPNSDTSQVTGPGKDDYRVGSEGSDLPLPSGTPWSLSQVGAAEPNNGSTNRVLRHTLNKSAVCEPGSLEQCARFDFTSAPDRVFSINHDKYRIGAEEFRTLRSSLDLVRRQQPLKTLLITSPLPGEGKTFVAVNLAHTLAWRRDQRVLLIDGDLRQSRVHKCFEEMPQGPGLADYLSGEVDPVALIRRGPGDNFFVLPAGRSVPNALEVIGNGKLKPLIQWLATAFDWIVIDSPPTVPVSDARLIAECTDGILFVLRAGRTPSDLAQRSAKQIRGRRYLGIVLNAVEASSTASSYYYGGNGNGAGRKQTS